MMIIYYLLLLLSIIITNMITPRSEDMIGEVAIPPARKLEDLIRSVDIMLFYFIWSDAYISVNYFRKVTTYNLLHHN